MASFRLSSRVNYIAAPTDGLFDGCEKVRFPGRICTPHVLFRKKRKEHKEWLRD
jgi:hypothetical protein